MIAAICCTYRRHSCLKNTIAQWLAQTYSGDRHLVILSDGGDVDAQREASWSLYTRDRRYGSLSAKHRDAVELARTRHGADRIVVMDDDDCYLPTWLALHAATLELHDVSRPTRKLANDGVGFGKVHQRENLQRLNHSFWGWRMRAYDACGGYSEEPISNFDAEFLNRLVSLPGISIGDPWPDPEPIPCIYRWFTASKNGSAYGADLVSSQDQKFERFPGPITPQFDKEAMLYWEQRAGGVI
jgi:hypothetical protein